MYCWQQNITNALEVENTIDELKVHSQWLQNSDSFSKTRAKLFISVYGWLLGHWAVRALMFQVADSAQISPLRLSFTGTLNVLRRAVTKFQRVEPEVLPFFGSGL